MKIDQIAYYAANRAQADNIKHWLGLADPALWIKDRVTADSTVWGKGPFENVAELQFNYSLGIELEIIRYVEGTHWHGTGANNIERPIISHVGVHLDDGEDFPAMEGCELAQETFTKSHTAEYLTLPGSPAAGRLYHYRIFAMGPNNFIKFIRRIHPVKK